MVGPPWWIQNGVKPGGPEKDMGGWKAIQFTAEQQAKYGCNAEGEVVDQAVHDAAFRPEAPVGPPWWILNDVTPEGPEKDMGGWKAMQFTAEQQAKYGCNAEGEVVDQAVHDAAFKPAAQVEKHGEAGYLDAGGDLLVEDMTVEDAIKKAATLPGCKGFTFNGSGTGKMTMYFKDHFQFSAASDWTSYKCTATASGGYDAAVMPIIAAEPEIMLGGPVVGGTGDEKDGDEELQKICEDLKDSIEKKAKEKGWTGTVEELKVLKYKSQVVAGTNYFVKAHINGANFFHLRIFEPLPHTGEKPVLHAIDVEKGDVPVEYFR